jgi:sugar O-acyltransferase (sialic acid O-acetyltransferase NeuD family)
MKRIFLIGAGGHCRSVIDVVESTAQYEIGGLIDIPDNVGKKIGCYEIVGHDAELEKFVSPGNCFLITLGQIKTAKLRKNIFEKLRSLNAEFATVVSARAYVSPTAKIASGSVVMHDALVNSYAVVGENCIINTKALIEHDTHIGPHCHISTGAIVNGEVHVGEESFVGSQAVLRHAIKIPAQSIVSAGSFYDGK